MNCVNLKSGKSKPPPSFSICRTSASNNPGFASAGKQKPPPFGAGVFVVEGCLDRNPNILLGRFALTQRNAHAHQTHTEQGQSGRFGDLIEIDAADSLGDRDGAQRIPSNASARF